MDCNLINLSSKKSCSVFVTLLPYFLGDKRQTCRVLTLSITKTTTQKIISSKALRGFYSKTQAKFQDTKRYNVVAHAAEWLGTLQ